MADYVGLTIFFPSLTTVGFYVFPCSGRGMPLLHLFLGPQ